MLIINCCEFDDEDEYTIEVLGKTSTARLTVEGKCWAAITGHTLTSRTVGCLLFQTKLYEYALLIQF